MNRSTLVLLVLALTLRLDAQTPIGKMVVGIEAGFDVQHFSRDITPRVLPTVQVEYPVGKFSFGFGLSKKIFRDFNYPYATGLTEQALVGEEWKTFFLYEEREFDLGYWSIPVKANYRFRCNCMYLHGGVSFDFLDTRKPERTVGGYYRAEEALPNELTREKLMKPRTRSYELGMGFKLHANDFFRLVARPTYVLSENPMIDSENPFISTLRMTFGVQYAFFHY
jgi:hypothetical protein